MSRQNVGNNCCVHCKGRWHYDSGKSRNKHNTPCIDCSPGVYAQWVEMTPDYYQYERKTNRKPTRPMDLELTDKLLEAGQIDLKTFAEYVSIIEGEVLA